MCTDRRNTRNGWGYPVVVPLEIAFKSMHLCYYKVHESECEMLASAYTCYIAGFVLAINSYNLTLKLPYQCSMFAKSETLGTEAR